jgi:hypothetical protein
MTAREIVETALGPLRTGYVFPDLAERAAAAIEVRLAAGEYDGMDEATLADLLTSQLPFPPRMSGPLAERGRGPRPAR